jgi:hypothetical protein
MRREEWIRLADAGSATSLQGSPSLGVARGGSSPLIRISRSAAVQGQIRQVAVVAGAVRTGAIRDGAIPIANRPQPLISGTCGYRLSVWVSSGVATGQP